MSLNILRKKQVAFGTTDCLKALLKTVPCVIVIDCNVWCGFPIHRDIYIYIYIDRYIIYILYI